MISNLETVMYALFDISYLLNDNSEKIKKNVSFHNCVSEKSVLEFTALATESANIRRNGGELKMFIFTNHQKLITLLNM